MNELLNKRAMEILKANDRGGYTVPTNGLYPYQWLWDSAFSALGIFEYDRARAWEEIETIFKSQWNDGMLPHMVFWKDSDTYFPGPDVWQAGDNVQSSGCSQPPVHTIVINKFLHSNPTESEKALALKLLPQMIDAHRWFYKARSINDSGVMAVIHPWESGRDNCPDWDDGMDKMSVDPELGEYVRKDTTHIDADERPSKAQYDRYLTIVKFGRDNKWDYKKIINAAPFWTADPGITFILHRANKELLEILNYFGHEEYKAEVEGWIELTEKGVQDIWSDEAKGFCAKNAYTGTFAPALSSASMLAFYAGLGTDEQKITLLRELEAMLDASEYSVPSWDPRDSNFESQRYWRGPLWIQMNYLISIGLKECGEAELAERIRQDTALLVEKEGFYEYYDSMTGKGCGGDEFSWTAALWLAWAGK